MKRREFLKQSLAVSAGLALGGFPKLARLAGADEPAKWRTFVVTTKVEVCNPLGGLRTWVPIPLMTNTNYFKRQGDTWTGNYSSVKSVQYDKYGPELYLPNGRLQKRL